LRTRTIGPFDYVIGGGGTAGCVLANRLSADPKNTVLLLQLLKSAGNMGTTVYHPVGTRKRGLDTDPMSVVTPGLKVRGVARLRVIDASIMPTITSGNTNSPTVMISERGAMLVAHDKARS
jgi:choline dehydrogenase-like flavoprotein